MGNVAAATSRPPESAAERAIESLAMAQNSMASAASIQ